MSRLSDKLSIGPRGLLAVSAGLLATLLAAPGEAQVTNWSLGDADGSWSVAGNWDNGIPNSDTADARFLGADLTALRTITLTGNTVVNAIRFTDTATPHFRLEISPTSPYTFTFAGMNPVIESGSYSGGDAALRIFAPVIVGSSGLTKIGSGSAAFMNTITGSGTLTFSGGTTEIRGNSTSFTGEIIINSGAALQARAFDGTGASVLGDTAHGTTINGTGQFATRDSSDKTISEPFILNGINITGSIRCYAGTNITINGPVTLNSDSSFAVADWTGGSVGDLRRFFVDSVIADGSGGTHNAYFLTDLSSGSYRGTNGRKSEIILGGQSTYGGNTYLTTNFADDGSGTYSGNLRLGVSNALPVGTTLVIGGSHSTGGGTLGTGAGSGKFALSGYNQELAGLTSNGTGVLNRVVGNSATLSTLTLNIASGTTNTYAGYLGWTEENDNNLALVKTGAGTVTLSANNTYAGGTTVSAGVLQTTSSGSLGSGNISVSSGAQLQLDAVGTYTIANAMTIAGNGVPGSDGAITSKAAGADVTLTGPITLTGSSDIKTRGTSTTRVTIAGGVDGSVGNHNLYLFSDNGGQVVVRDNPINIGTGILGGGFDLNVAGNTAGRLIAQWNQTVKLGVDNPFTAGPAVELGNNSGENGYYGKLDLNGHAFTASGLAEMNTNAPGTSEVTDSTGGGTFTLDNASGATSTFAGKITGNLALVKQGAGTLVFSGANTYTGTTTVSVGTLTIRTNSALGSSAALSGTTVAGGAVLKLEGGITVAEPITITGSGIGWSGALHNASGNNTWSGPITISGYTRIGAATGTVFTLSGGITGSSAIFGSDTGIIRIVDKPINVGTNGITVLNNGTVELNVGSNTWGSTTIEYGGTLKLGLDNAMPTTTVVRIGTGTTNGTFDLNAHNQTIAGLYDGSTGTRRVVNSGGGTPTLTINNATDYTYAGVLGIAGQDSFNLTKAGSGRMTLAGANVYTGLTTVSGGVLALGHVSALGATDSGTLVNTGGVLDLSGFNTAEPVTLNGGTLRNSVASTPITEFNGTLTLASQSEINSPVALSLVGQITGTGGFTKTGGEQIRLFNTTNNYQGPTIVEAGYVDIMTNEVIPDTSNLTLNKCLNLRGYTETVGGLSGNSSGFLYSSPGLGTLRIGGGNADGSYEGRILDNGGQVSIVKVGTGTQVFSGLTNIYTGTTRVEGGTLLVNGVHTGGGAYTVNAGATLGGTGSVGGATTVSSGGILAPGQSLGLLTFTNDVIFQDGATLTWEFLQTGTAGTDYDSIVGTDLILPETGTVNLNIAGLDGYTIKAGDSFTLFEGDVYQGSTLLALGTDVTDLFTISDNIGWWGTWEVTAGSLILTAVPEPSSLFLLAALAGMLLLERRRACRAHRAG